jgi:hypothetical protein
MIFVRWLIKNKEMSKAYYHIYVRSMLVYNSLNNLEYNKILEENIKLSANINRHIRTFEDLVDAEEYLLANGCAMSDRIKEIKYDEGITQPCVFYIIKSKVDDNFISMINNTLKDKENIWSYPTFAFNEEAYKMLLNEHLKNIQLGLIYEIPKNIVNAEEFYPDKIKYGIYKNHLDAIIALKGNCCFCESYKEAWNTEFEEYNKKTNDDKRIIFLSNLD